MLYFWVSVLILAHLLNQISYLFSTEGHLDYFQFFSTINNNAAIDMLPVYVPLAQV